ncbi:ExbD/TolR family protein [Thalassotalea ganghwensis]
MSRRKLFTEQTDADVDMTPMLDIVFILLIFFIVTTSFVREEGLLINKPKANTNTNDNNPSIVVKIDESGRYSFNGSIVDIERLQARIESFLAENSTTNALIIANKETSHEKVVKAIDKISSFGNLNVSIGKAE